MCSRRAVKAFDKIVDCVARFTCVIFMFFCYKMILFHVIGCLKNFRIVEAVLFGLLGWGLVTGCQKFADLLSGILLRDCYIGADKMHIAAMSFFVIADICLYLIGLFKPEVTHYRLHGPAIIASLAFLISAVQEIRNVQFMDDTDIARTAMNAVLFFFVLEYHYRFPLRPLWMAGIAVAIAFFVSVLYQSIRAVQLSFHKQKDKRSEGDTSSRYYSESGEQAAESAWEMEQEEYKRSYSNNNGSDYDDNWSYQSEDPAFEQGLEEPDFFSGCDDFKSLRKQYLRYCKELHPDNAGGNEELFKSMKSQYEVLSKKFVA